MKQHKQIDKLAFDIRNCGFDAYAIHEAAFKIASMGECHASRLAKFIADLATLLAAENARRFVDDVWPHSSESGAVVAGIYALTLEIEALPKEKKTPTLSDWTGRNCATWRYRLGRDPYTVISTTSMGGQPF